MENQYLQNDKVIEIARELYQINQLTHIKISDQEIIDWAGSLIELQKDVTPQWIRKIVNRMKLGQLEYDYRLGIRNIFNAFSTCFKPEENAD